MGLLDFLNRKTVDEPREPELRDRERILAYLEDLARRRTPVNLRCREAGGVTVPAKVELVTEQPDVFTLTLQRALPEGARAGLAVDLLFTMDNLRFSAPATLLARDAPMHAVVSVPDRVQHAERRGRIRARMAPRERANLVALEGLYEGTGISGKILDLSQEGVCLRVERAISIVGEKRLNVSAGLFGVGQKLMVVRLLDLPQTPMIECGGRICHIDDNPEGVQVGLHLEGLGAAQLQLLDGLLGRRLPTYGRGFPVRVRRRDLEDGGAQEVEPGQGPDGEGPDGEGPVAGARGGDGEAHPLTESPEVRALLEALEGGGGEEGGEAGERLRERAARRILLVMFDDLDRSILAGTFFVNGYTGVREARTFVEALDAFREEGVDLLVVDQTIGAHSAQTFLQKLRKSLDRADFPVVLLSEALDVRTTIMAKAAGIAHVQRKPVDFDGELGPVLDRLMASV